jgi:hypothetical protein
MFRELVARIDWRRDAVLWGRLLAIAIAVLGTVYASMEAWNLSDFSDSLRARYLIATLLGVLWYSSVILIVTEIVARLRGAEVLSNRNVADFARVAGVLVVIVGLAVTIWSAVDDQDIQELSDAELVRYVLQSVLSGYLWQGGLLMILASIADTLGWNDEELPNEEEASVVATEP